MKFPPPQYIANLLIERGNNLDFKKLEDVLFEICRSKLPSPSDEEIFDYIELSIEDIARDLYAKKTDSISDAITINFILDQDGDEYYIKFLNTPETEMLRQLQRDTPENFEIFCTKILSKLGGNTIVSGSPDDGGIDFSSTEILINNLPIISTKGSRIVVIGQAKRYKDGNHVREKELREFVGASVRRIDTLKKTRSEHFGTFQPIILAFWTTSDFHPKAKDYAKDLGIWYLGGLALCQLAINIEVEV